MPDARKDYLLRWLPAFIALIGFIGNAVYVGKWIGAVEQRVEFVEKAVTVYPTTYLTRNEFVLQKENRDGQMVALNKTLTRIEEKLDKVVERELAGRLSKND